MTFFTSPDKVKTLLVLDTNIILDLFHFYTPSLLPLRTALENGKMVCVTDSSCMTELQRVVTYPELGLSPDAGQTLLMQYEALARFVDGEGSPVFLPRCKDREDQRFLELAARSGAQWLVSRDKRVLQLRRHRSRLPFVILSPQEVVRLVDGA